MTNKLWCDVCDGEIKDKGAHIEMKTGCPATLKVGETINMSDVPMFVYNEGDLHFHIDCFKEIGEKMKEELGGY